MGWMVLCVTLIAAMAYPATSTVEKEFMDGQPWAKQLYDMLASRHTIAQEGKNLIRIKNAASFTHTESLFEKALKNIEVFQQAELDVPEDPKKGRLSSFNTFSGNYLVVHTDSSTTGIDHRHLIDATKERGDKLLNTLIRNLNGRRKSNEPYALKVNCGTIPLKRIPKEFTINDVCSDFNTCAKQDFPYGTSSSDGHSKHGFKTACTHDNKCDVAKAVPLMVGVIWFKITDWMVEKICPTRCNQGSCDVTSTYNKLVEDMRVLMAYIKTMPAYKWHDIWKPFYSGFITEVKKDTTKAVALAMSETKQKLKLLEVTPRLCSPIKYPGACALYNIYGLYQMIEKNRQYRLKPGVLKDLRLLSRVDEAKMLQIQRDDIHQAELLRSLGNIDANLHVVAKGISGYFKGLAEYDVGIADADVLFIQGELDKYEAALKEVYANLKSELNEAMGHMKWLTALNLASEAAELVLKIAENGNPFKWIFGGPDLKDILDQTNVVADKATEVVKSTALLISVTKLKEDAGLLSEAFVGNRVQISSLKSVVEKIRKGESKNIGPDSELFIEQYASYTPQTDNSRLQKNQALWSAFKDATCGLLEGEVGVGGAIPKGIAGGKLLCEKLEGTLAQLSALQDDIFDFQFQLVDAVASVVRGNIAGRLAGFISASGDNMNAGDIMTGILVMQGKLQTMLSVYCDTLEYKTLGKAIPGCKPSDGLFAKANLDRVIQYKVPGTYEEITTTLYIPTRPQHKGDTAFIDILALARGEKVLFKPRRDSNWLLDHDWILDENYPIPFVLSFELFLPNKEYNSKQRRITVTITSVAGSSVNTKGPNVLYLLPRGNEKYLTIYDEGFNALRCQSKIFNPYRLCTDSHLPDLCDISTRQTTTKAVHPTILSTWQVELSVRQRSRKLTWIAPHSATNLLLVATAKLQMPHSSKRKRSLRVRNMILSRLYARSSGGDGCCQGNTYKKDVYSDCEACPAQSTAIHRGLYCEINA